MVEFHTVHWLIFEILGFSVIPANIASAVASFLIGISPIAILLVFVVTLVSVFTGMSLWRLADVGKQSERSIPRQTAITPTALARDKWWLWLGLGLAIGVALWLIPYIQQTDGIYKGRPLAIAWVSARLAEYSTSTISAFILDAYNPGPNEVTLQDAYILSSIDSTKIPMQIIRPRPEEDIPISDAMPVPRHAYLSFSSPFGAGLLESEFIKQWRDFDVVLEFDGIVIRRNFNSQWVDDQIIKNHPETQAHVSRRPH